MGSEFFLGFLLMLTYIKINKITVNYEREANGLRVKGSRMFYFLYIKSGNGSCAAKSFMHEIKKLIAQKQLAKEETRKAVDFIIFQKIFFVALQCFIMIIALRLCRILYSRNGRTERTA